MPFLQGFFKQDPVRTSLDLETSIFELTKRISYKEYALQLCINKLASSLALCRFDTYEKGKKKHDHYWWRFNFEPNNNVNSIDFLYQIIYEMVHNEDGALIIQTDDGHLVVAESYDIYPSSLYENIYQNIQLYGGYQYERGFYEKDVLRVQLPNKKVKTLLNGVYDDYGQLIQATANAYMRERSMKLKLNIKSMFNQNFGSEEEENKFYDDLFTKRFKSIFKPGDTITPLEEGLELSSIDESRASTVSGQIKATEVTELFSETINLFADAFAIPRGLLKGDVADVETMTSNFITYAVRPLAKEIESEINRKLYKREAVTEGTKLKIVTNTINTNNVVSLANAADKLISATVATPNEMREELDWEPSDKESMDEFRMTKNYSRIGYEDVD